MNVVWSKLAEKYRTPGIDLLCMILHHWCAGLLVFMVMLPAMTIILNDDEGGGCGHALHSLL